jgi:hypothetical protein
VLERQFVLRGFGVGAIGGVLAFIFARIMAEPIIQSSIDYESGRDAVQDMLRKAAGLAAEPAGPDIFSRGLQRNIGIGTGLLLFGAAMGGIFAVAYYIAHRKAAGRVAPRTLAVLVAGGCFLGLYLVPFLKYPANPPAIGHPDTIQARGFLYLGMVAISVAALIGAVVAARRLTPAWGAWNATLAAGLGFIVLIAIAQLIFPPLGHLHSNVTHFGNFDTETPQPLKNAKGAIVYPGFPADQLFKFRLYSVISQLILWTTIGLGFGPLVERVLAKNRGHVGDPYPSASSAAAA